MTTGELLEAHYAAMEARYDLTNSGDYQHLVTPSGNDEEPIHRWYRLKEAFSHRLLRRVTKDLGLDSAPSLSLFDPFSGSGTTAVSAAQSLQDGDYESVHFRGVETNPFLHLLGASKLRSFQDTAADFTRLAGAIAASALQGDFRGAAPQLSTFNTEFFPGTALEELVALVGALDHVSGTKGRGLSYDLARLAIASAVEPSSILRKDGRALRRVGGRKPTSPVDTFLSLAERIDEDLPPRPVQLTGGIEAADIRTWALNEREVGQFDLALFSPPYPNNIDYTEVYKMEAWLLGMISSQPEFADQRRRTLRSHGSLNWSETYPQLDVLGSDFCESLLGPVLAAIPDGRYRRARRQLVLGYADDMAACLQRVHSALRPGGYFACVVGNSLHGSHDTRLLVASDLIIARLAEALGFDVVGIEVARVPTRRRTDSPYLRESVVFGRLPIGRD